MTRRVSRDEQPTMGPADVGSLRQHLQDWMKELHGRPDRLRDDPELLSSLLPLAQGDEIGRLSDFVAARRPDLEVLFTSHERWPDVAVLDLVEAILVLELLERAPFTLASCWPRPWRELARLAEHWAVPI
jgi:hypothetical protein